MNIFVAVPTYETITPDTFKSIYNMKTGEHKVTFDFVRGYDCAKARNIIAKRTVDEGFDHVLMIDSDIIVPENALLHMLEHPAEVVLGCYPHKNTKKHEVELFKLGQPDFVERFTYDELPVDFPRMSVKGGGMGCALIQADAFSRLPFPWFKYVIYNSGSVLSEDLYFCNEARKAGMKVQGDTRVKCGHMFKHFEYS